VARGGGAAYFRLAIRKLFNGNGTIRYGSFVEAVTVRLSGVTTRLWTIKIEHCGSMSSTWRGWGYRIVLFVISAGGVGGDEFWSG